MPMWPKRKARPNVDEYGRTKLWVCCGEACDLEGMKRELANGADPDQGDDAGYVPLHIATLTGNVSIVKELLKVGANPNAIDKHGNSPLWTAILSAPNEVKIELIELLLLSGADPHWKNVYGKSPYEAATTIAHGLEIPFQKVGPHS